MQIALALYPNFTMLDIIGPFQVLADVPGHEVVFVAAEAGPVVDHTGRATLIATTVVRRRRRAGHRRRARWARRHRDPTRARRLAPRRAPDDDVDDERLHRLHLPRRRRDPRRARRHDALGPQASARAAGRSLQRPSASSNGARSSPPPVSRAASTWPSSCSIACTDPRCAQMVQLAIEYDPQPPFDAGSPAKAPAALVDLVQQQIGDGPALPATTTTGGSR